MNTKITMNTYLIEFKNILQLTEIESDSYKLENGFITFYNTDITTGIIDNITSIRLDEIQSIKKLN
jgi:hypothetical protein